ncbi:SDR family NAD(P)-dependent oxidoreductase [Taibaiella koreensis]|uniref:SDR family NAD(P)-dependent oxidoreductase n=1 Tax=Taibaiella koreensis TaxID=1268548 RepID=UPI000E59AFC9|nr:glucose 1-dehydrogenase [Taibaiella koreensis]
MARLKNKVAIVTGAASGMGEATATLFAAEGASVLLTDIQEEKLRSVVGRIRLEGNTADFIIHDVSNEASWQKVVETAIDLYGKIDILVNNAGITGNLFAPIPERSADEFNRVLSVNLLSQFLGIKAVVSPMQQAGGGAIINISSIGGIIGSAGATAYTASKGGSRALTKGAAAELAKDRIRVNSVHPGYVATPMTTMMEGAEDFAARAIGTTPLGRGGTPEEIAFAVLYLASDESSFTTGAKFVIDGGTIAL